MMRLQKMAKEPLEISSVSKATKDKLHFHMSESYAAGLVLVMLCK